MNKKYSIVFVLILIFVVGCNKKPNTNTSRYVPKENREGEHLTEIKSNIRPDTGAVTHSKKTIEQSNGVRLTIVEIGNKNVVVYVETLDGYTLLLNSINIFEYALLDKNGELSLSGVEARNEGHRTRYELKFLESHPKHIRKDTKMILKEIEEKKKK